MACQARVRCGRDMDWTAIVPFAAVLGVLVAMWGRLDSKIETRLGRLAALLTDNLIALNREVGELKGAAHTRTPN